MNSGGSTHVNATNGPFNNAMTPLIAEKIEAEFTKVRSDWRNWKDADGIEHGVSYYLLVEGNALRPILVCPDAARDKFHQAMRRAIMSLGYERS